MKRALFPAVVFCLALSGTVHADEPAAGAQPPDFEKMQEEMRNAQKQMEKQRQEELERMRQIDPKAYEWQKKAQERQEQIGQILSAYQQNAISADDAERRLTPLIRQEVQQELSGMDDQIKTAERKLAALKQAKSNPGTLVKKRVDQMLGRGGPPSPDDLF